MTEDKNAGNIIQPDSVLSPLQSRLCNRKERWSKSLGGHCDGQPRCPFRTAGHMHPHLSPHSENCSEMKNAVRPKPLPGGIDDLYPGWVSACLTLSPHFKTIPEEPPLYAKITEMSDKTTSYPTSPSAQSSFAPTHTLSFTLCPREFHMGRSFAYVMIHPIR